MDFVVILINCFMKAKKYLVDILLLLVGIHTVYMQETITTKTHEIKLITLPIKSIAMVKTHS